MKRHAKALSQHAAARLAQSAADSAGFAPLGGDPGRASDEPLSVRTDPFGEHAEATLADEDFDAEALEAERPAGESGLFGGAGAHEESSEEAEEASEADEADPEGALYPGDRGTLPLDVRRMLVLLLRGPYVTRAQSRRLWDVMMGSLPAIRSRLSDLFLELVVDEEMGIAFCRRPDMGELDAPTLLPKLKLPFFDSAVMLELREKLMHARETGERCVATASELEEMLRFYDAAADKNERLFKSHFQAMLGRLEKRRFLLPLESQNYEVSPVLALMFTAADIAALSAAYAEKAGALKQLAAEGGGKLTLRRRRRRKGEAAESAEDDAQAGDALDLADMEDDE